MAQVTKDNLKIGQHVFMAGYVRHSTNTEVPVELIISSEPSGAHGSYVNVTFADPAQEKLVYGPSHDVDDFTKFAIYPGDLGVEGFKYDNRAPQLFTTVDEITTAIEMWSGRNPNFLTPDGEDIPKTHIGFSFDDFDFVDFEPEYDFDGKQINY